MMPTDTDLMRMAIDGGHLRRNHLRDLWRAFWHRTPPSVLPHIEVDTPELCRRYVAMVELGKRTERQRRAARPMSDLEARIVAEHIRDATP